MKTKIFLLAAMLTICSLSGKAQWVVTDPTNLVQGIVNTANQVIQTSSTAANMLKNFQEVQKVYSQGKQYYDALKSVHDLVKDARKVQQTILLVGDISDIYVNSFQKMIADENFSVEELKRHCFGLCQTAGGKQRGADRTENRYFSQRAFDERCRTYVGC